MTTPSWPSLRLVSSSSSPTDYVTVYCDGAETRALRGRDGAYRCAKCGDRTAFVIVGAHAGVREEA